MSLCSVLLVDDEELLCRHLSTLLRRQGYTVATAPTAELARRRMEEISPDVVLLDLRLPDADGCELMVELKSSYPQVEFIIITAHGSIKSAVKSTHRGAADYLTKPFEFEELEVAIANAMSRHFASEQLRRLSSAGVPSDDPYRSTVMRRLMKDAERAARQEGMVLLLGESGTGKDRIARWIHEHSARAGGPFFTINCAALPWQLAESELFGHEAGAFTGTKGRKRGLLELAERGTLLLNEVGEMDLVLQAKLLTFLDTRRFVRVGGERTISVDARLMAATNRDLAAQVEQGTFRRDLYYRLNVMPIKLPRLQDRVEDIPQIVTELLVDLRSVMGLHRQPEVADDALRLLCHSDWPGNVRELRNVLERALIASEGDPVQVRHLRMEHAQAGWSFPVTFPEGQTLHDVTREVAVRLINEALRRASTKREAAAMLGLSRHALAYQMKTLGVIDEGLDE